MRVISDSDVIYMVARASHTLNISDGIYRLSGAFDVGDMYHLTIKKDEVLGYLTALPERRFTFEFIRNCGQKNAIKSGLITIQMDLSGILTKPSILRNGYEVTRYFDFMDLDLEEFYFEGYNTTF